MIHRLGIPALFLFAAAAMLPAQDRTLPPTSRPTGEYIDAVVAKVNRTVITKSQVDRQLGAAVQRMPPSDYEVYFRRELLKQVAGAIEQDAVERVGLVVPKRYILEQIEQQKEKRGASELMQGIKEQGYKSEEEYIEAFSKNVSRETYLAAQSGQFGSKNPQFRPDYWTEPTASEVRRYYRQHEADQFTQKNQAHLYAIFLPYRDFNDPGANKDDLSTGKAHVLTIAETIREELARGTEFGVLARRYGREAKVDEGGDFGWVSTGAPYQKEIVEFALNGPVKELSPPIPYPSVTTPRGIALAWVAERVEHRVMPFAEAQQKIRDALRLLRVEAARKKILQKMIEDAYVSPGDVKRDLFRMYTQ